MGWFDKFAIHALHSMVVLALHLQAILYSVLRFVQTFNFTGEIFTRSQICYICTWKMNEVMETTSRPQRDHHQAIQ